MLPYIPYMDPMGHKFPWKNFPNKTQVPSPAWEPLWPWWPQRVVPGHGDFMGYHGVLGLWKKAIVMGYIMLNPNLWSISWDIMAIYIYIHIYLCICIIIYIYVYVCIYIYVYTLIAHKKKCHLLLVVVIFHV